MCYYDEYDAELERDELRKKHELELSELEEAQALERDSLEDEISSKLYEAYQKRIEDEQLKDEEAYLEEKQKWDEWFWYYSPYSPYFDCDDE